MHPQDYRSTRRTYVRKFKELVHAPHFFRENWPNVPYSTASATPKACFVSNFTLEIILGGEPYTKWRRGYCYCYCRSGRNVAVSASQFAHSSAPCGIQQAYAEGWRHTYIDFFSLACGKCFVLVGPCDPPATTLTSDGRLLKIRCYSPEQTDGSVVFLEVRCFIR